MLANSQKKIIKDGHMVLTSDKDHKKVGPSRYGWPYQTDR